MKCKIYKYQLPVNPGEFGIDMPLVSEAISVGIQNDVPYMWCKVDTESKVTNKKFLLLFTGQEFEGNLNGKFVGTYSFDSNVESDKVHWTEYLVYHLFQLDL